MQMRLAFAVSIHTEPEVLLIDEALSVGDHSFQSKCFERIRSFKAEGRTIVLVSHDVDQVRAFCDAAIWLDSGRLILHGRPEVVVSQYVEEADRLLNHRCLVDAETKLRTPKSKTILTTSQGAKLRLNENRVGSLEVEIVDVLIVDIHGRPVTEIDSGGILRIELRYLCSEPVLGPIFQVYMFRDDGLVCYDVNSALEGWYSGSIEGDGQVALQIDTAGLPSGRYLVEVGCWAKDWGYAYDYHSEVYSVNIHGSAERISSPGGHQWEFNPRQVSEGRHSCR
jgi:lipopolysaccharide transport system ATP-binding protein